MKLMKTFFLAALALAALTAFVTGPASATVLTGSEKVTWGKGTTIHAASEGTIAIHQSWPRILQEPRCNSTFSGQITRAGSSTETVLVGVGAFNFTSCSEGWTPVLINPGTLEFHTSGESSNNNGLLISNGTEWTEEREGVHCVYRTSNTTLGTVTGSAVTGGNATLDVETTIPRVGGRSGTFCGSGMQWTGSYKFTSPAVLNVD